MLEYATLQPLLSFLEVSKLPRRHWSDNASWELAECLFNQVQLKTKEIMSKARFFSITCDDVTMLDTQSWISIHTYICENWTRTPLLLSLERVVDVTNSDNLTIVIKNVIKTLGGVEEASLPV